jgi:hypothetical protein
MLNILLEFLFNVCFSPADLLSFVCDFEDR